MRYIMLGIAVMLVAFPGGGMEQLAMFLAGSVVGWSFVDVIRSKGDQ